LLFVVCACSPVELEQPRFQPPTAVATAAAPQLVPLSLLAAPVGSEAEAIAALGLDAEALATRAEALRARARLASGEVITAEERARLLAAAARWTGP
jgi:glucose/arabinose dehydrogenase